MKILTENHLRLHIRKTLEKLLNEAEAPVTEGEELIENEPQTDNEEEDTVEEASIRSHAHGRTLSKRPDTFPDQFKRDAIKEAVAKISNFIKTQPETATKQLKDNSKPEILCDPLDVALNQRVGELGSDGGTPTVAVTVGAKKGGNGPNTGQAKAKFTGKTKLA